MLHPELRLCPVPVCDRPVHHELARGPREGIEFFPFKERSGKSGSNKETPDRKACDEQSLIQGRREFDQWLGRRAPLLSMHSQGPRHTRRSEAWESRQEWNKKLGRIPRGRRVEFAAALAALGTGLRIFAIRHGIYKGDRPKAGDL